MPSRIAMWWLSRRGARFAREVERCRQALTGAGADDAAGRLAGLLDYAEARTAEERRSRCLDGPLAAGHALLGRYWHQKGSADEALKHMERAFGAGGLCADDLLLLADMKAQVGRVDDAARAVLKALFAKVPRPPIEAPVTRFVRAHWEIAPTTPARQFADRAAACEEFLQAGCRMPAVIFSAALGARARGAAPQALQPYAEALPDAGASSNASDPEDHIFRARVLAVAGHCEEAGRLLALLEDRAGDNWLYLYARGCHYMRSGRPEAARTDFQACERAPGAPVGIVEIQRGHIAMMTANLPEARASYERAQQADPGDWQAAYWCGRVALCLGQHGQARTSFMRGIELGAPAEACYAAGVASELLDQPGEAAALYSRCARDARLRGPALLRAALCEAKMGRLTEAADLLVRVSAEPGCATASRYYSGAVAARQGHYERAVSAWSEVAEEPWASYARPRRAAARYLLAEKEFAAGRWTDAVDHWANAMPDLPPVGQQVARASIAEARFRSASPQGAGKRRASLNDILTELPSPRREYYTFVSAVARQEVAAPLPPQLLHHPRYGARARFHQAMQAAVQGALADDDLQVAVAADSRYGRPAALVRLRHSLSTGVRGDALAALTELLKLPEDGAE